MSTFEVGDSVRVIGKNLEPYDLRVGTVEAIVESVDDTPLTDARSYRVADFVGEPVLPAQWFAAFQIEPFPNLGEPQPVIDQVEAIQMYSNSPLLSGRVTPPLGEERRKWVFETVLPFAERFNANETFSGYMGPDDIISFARDVENFLVGLRPVSDYELPDQVGLALAADEMYTQRYAALDLETDPQEGN